MAKMNNKKIGGEGQIQTSGAGHCEDGSSLEPPELFCSLGSLIVEGRLPAPPGGGGRGYTEGPHVELPGRISRHKCSQTEYLCNKNENFRKHMLLLWQNNVPMSIEILLCSDCRVGEAKARSLEVTTVPEPGSILLEQWTVACVSRGAEVGAEVTGLSLLQAVRSYLHFSQLSAWYSKTAGTKPWNVLIRITIPGQEFASKFSQPAEEHLFPVASAGGGAQLSVGVRSLPRTEDIPTVICSHNQAGGKIKGAAEVVIKGAAPDPEEAEEAKLGIAGALAWREGGDLRRSLVKSKLAASDLDCPGYGRLTKSDSMDSMLGDSLLDPPPSLAKMTPRRYQSPSRCGSPSLEAPEPLMGLRGQPQPPSYDQAMAMRGTEAECPDMARLNRHDLLRRRDLSLFHGLHPRLFQNQQRLSLPPKPAQQPGPRPPPASLPCRAVTPGHQPPMVTSDTLPVRCTISGKHICQFEEEVVEHHTISPDLGSSPQPSGSHYRQGELGAKAKGWSSRLGRTSTPYSRDSSSDSSSTSKEPPRSSKEPLCHEEMEDVLAFLKTRRSPLSSESKERSETARDDLLSCKSSRRPSFEELRPSSSVTQVYRTELSNNNNNFVQVNQKPDKTNLFLEAILRPQLTDSKIATPGIHSLRETSKYCSQSGDSSNDASPLTPVHHDHHHDHHHDQILPEEENNNVDIIPGCEPSPWLSRSPDDIFQEGLDYDISVGDLCQDLQSKCLITKKGGGVVKRSLSPLSDLNVRVRSLSENCHNIGGQAPEARVRPTLQPLDFSFEECEDSWSVTHDEVGSSETSFVVGDKRRKSIEEEDGVPSANKKNAFRKSFDSAASMVFQRRTGLPLTSSPAPMRRGIKFDFDSGISTPKDIKRALFEPQSPEESECGSPKKKKRDPRKLLSTSAPATISNNNLLCNFEESVLNGRLEPVSTVEGFTAEIGASGSFQPKHLTFPVTVFFYTLCENSNYASPYLGHINLGKKGYRIPDRGTIQLTLFNPLGTVVKMFVVMYDLTDMPPNSQTFLRQRTLYMPHDKTDSDPDAQKWLRYLIHLRVASSKSGKIYLHTDVRMIIFRKSDLDTATDHENGKGWELRSFTRSPSNPKFSPRK